MAEQGPGTTHGTMMASVNDQNGVLAGRPLAELREEYRYWLFDDFLPFLDAHVIDHDLGGFMCNARPDGTPITTQKKPGHDGRGVWVYSFLYRHVEANPSFLQTAEKTAQVLLKTQPAGDSLWPAVYSKEGKALRGPTRSIYSDLSVAEGFQELAKATGDRRWWEAAKELLFKCLRCYDRPDYQPELAQAYYYLGPGASRITGPRCVGEWMVLYRVAAQMLESETDADLEEVKQRCIDAVFDRHYNPECDLINELLEYDFSLPDNEIAQLVYPGHVVQIMWMFMYEAVRTRDQQLFEKSQRAFMRHLEISLDRVYGGVFQCLQHVDDNTWLCDKPLWAQEEPLVGLLCAIEHTEDRRARELFGDLYGYVLDNFPLRRHGFPLWNLQADRRASFESAPTRIGNFHHPRHLMLNLLALDRMIERNGRTSDVWS